MKTKSKKIIYSFFTIAVIYIAITKSIDYSETVSKNKNLESTPLSKLSIIDDDLQNNNLKDIGGTLYYSVFKFILNFSPLKEK